MNRFTLLPICAAVLLSGCSTIFTGNTQYVEVRTHNDIVDQKLDNVVKFDVISDRDRRKHKDMAAGEQFSVHRTGDPIAVKIIESECILPTEEKFDSSLHPAVILDVLMTSLLSTSIDSSTGALWQYDDTLYVTPKVKDTPECQKWLNEQVAKMDPNVLSSQTSKRPETDKQYLFDTESDSVVHPSGYERNFKKK